MFKANWKTTVFGVLSAFFSFVLFKPEFFGGASSWIHGLAQFVVVGGLAGLGITAKDYNVTGGTKQNK